MKKILVLFYFLGFFGSFNLQNEMSFGQIIDNDSIKLRNYFRSLNPDWEFTFTRLDTAWLPMLYEDITYKKEKPWVSFYKLGDDLSIGFVFPLSESELVIKDDHLLLQDMDLLVYSKKHGRILYFFQGSEESIEYRDRVYYLEFIFSLRRLHLYDEAFNYMGHIFLYREQSAPNFYSIRFGQGEECIYREGDFKELKKYSAKPYGFMTYSGFSNFVYQVFEGPSLEDDSYHKKCSETEMEKPRTLLDYYRKKE